MAEPNGESVGVLIVTWNAARFIAACLDAALAQQQTRLRVVVVDNGSTDATVAIIAGYGAAVSLIRNKENLGFCRATNQAASAAGEPDFFLTLNSDVVLAPDYVRILLDMFSGHPLVGMAQGIYLRMDGTRIDSAGLRLSWCRRFFNCREGRRWRPASAWARNPRPIFGPCAAAALYRHALVSDIRWGKEFFDDHFFYLGDDFDVAWRARRCGWHALVVPQARCRHYRESSPHTSASRQYLAARNRYYLLLKNESLPGFLLRAPLLLFYDIPRLGWLWLTNSRTRSLWPEIRARRRCLAAERAELTLRRRNRLVGPLARCVRVQAPDGSVIPGIPAPVHVIITGSCLRRQCLPSVLAAVYAQSLPPQCVTLIYDGDEPPELAGRRQEAFSQLAVVTNPDGLPITAVQNKVIFSSQAEFILVLNDDVVPDRDYIRYLVAVMRAAPAVGIATGKLVRPDRRTIDSAGQLLAPNRTPADRGYEQPDQGQYDAGQAVFSACGAAALYRRRMLDTLCLSAGEYFDNDYHMFYEDLDIGWRARAAGWTIWYTPQACAVHERGASARRHVPLRRRMAFSALPPLLQRYCLYNRYATIIKNDRLAACAPDMLSIMAYDIKLWVYLLCFRPFLTWRLLAGLPELLQRAKRKRCAQQGRPGGAQR